MLDHPTDGMNGCHDEPHFEYALGFAVVRLWAILQRETQERLFNEATAADDSLREGLATFLQERHAKTTHKTEPKT
jgi:hypothetical protein